MYININTVEKQISEVVSANTVWIQIAHLTVNCLNFQKYDDVFHYLRTASLLNLGWMFLDAFLSFFAHFRYAQFRISLYISNNLSLICIRRTF